MIIRRPLSPDMVMRAAESLWEAHRELEGRVPWGEAASWAREPYERQALLALDAAFVQDLSNYMRVGFLKKFAKECLDVAEMLQ